MAGADTHVSEAVSKAPDQKSAGAAAALNSRLAAPPLESWNEGASKRAILDFVERVTTPGGVDFVAPRERIAVFDNDGTLWAEKPFYFQGLFIFDRIRSMASAHTDWKERQPFKAILEHDMAALASGGVEAQVELVTATHAGMTTDEFQEIVEDWLAVARHPTLDRPYTELVYQPMLELLNLLRAHDFKTFIVSGGGIEFLRVFAEETYGVPPEQIVGSNILTTYEVRDGVPMLVREPKVDFIDDKEGKPVGINRFIGRRPIAAFGNSDGDFAMLEWVCGGPGPRLGLLVHHDDDAREFAYDRASSSGKLDRGLDEAEARGWTRVSMAKDWNQVFRAR